MLCCLIMAGGKGERFWPASSEEKPKQFLNILGAETMLQGTVRRMEKLVPIENIFICTSTRHVRHVVEQLPRLPKRNIIEEPLGKNTSPCIVLTALISEEYYGEVTLIVVPSDHKIEAEEKYIGDIKAGVAFVEETKGAIAILGITPDRPETGFGYIKLGELEKSMESVEIFKIKKFIEKPDKTTAESYLKDGGYLWNCGMYIWKTNTIKNLAKEYIPNIYNNLKAAMKNFNQENFEDSLLNAYLNIEGVSIDVGIMEKAKDIFIIPGNFIWDDVGTWISVERNGYKDHKGNTYIGDIHVIEGKNNFIMAGNKKIILMDVENLFVIDSDKYIVIGKKDLINSVAALKKEFEDPQIINKVEMKKHIILDKERLKNKGLSIYTMDECVDNCSIEKYWSKKIDENQSIGEVQLVSENNKNYIVGKSNEDIWLGVEISSDIVNVLKEMDTEIVFKFLFNELSK